MLEDLDPVAVKTGMLASAAVVRLVAERCADRILVVDPVLVATSGAVLGDADVVAAYRDVLLPVATVATPNEDELEALGRPTGDHVLVTRGGDIPTTNDHGTGCTHSAALAAYLAHGVPLADAATRADAYVARQAPPRQGLDPRPRPRAGRAPLHHPPHRRNQMTVHPAHTRIEAGDLRVPFTRVALTNGETFDRYCTSGPGSEPEAGLPPRRAEWIAARADTTPYDGRETQARRQRPRCAAPRCGAGGVARCAPAPAAGHEGDPDGLRPRRDRHRGDALRRRARAVRRRAWCARRSPPGGRSSPST
ncbi:bifunctional hydroxymethylpyrimidine kinase/phosphomethylpyrimidine kinase [Nocardioides convexus]|uniref:bifunctional hydroxymethylpyrimidine kinase/phosphomethylpyrimidine kinase n=1 Tax=Nocardioides convexus TaxID=2712224 RepID=UPI0024184766|nr:bifunctional hydroxymethylpyrimidine kinase/phosphomethylpyrimidine kinase [Nocardioides convexus]